MFRTVERVFLVLMWFFVEASCIIYLFIYLCLITRMEPFGYDEAKLTTQLKTCSLLLLCKYINSFQMSISFAVIMFVFE